MRDMMKKKATYRKRRQNRFSMFLVGVVVLMLMGAVTVKSIELQQKIDIYAAKEEQLKAQIEAENQRAQEIEEFGKYTQTKGYIEETAKDKLGLVYEGEILFKEDQ